VCSGWLGGGNVGGTGRNDGCDEEVDVGASEVTCAGSTIGDN